MSTADGTRKFHFLREIASGGFGRVYLAKVLHGDGFSRLAAVKVLHPKWTENEEVAQRMRDEARLLGMLRHRNIVDVMDLTRIDGRVAVVMEYLEAVDLKVVITDALRTGTRIPLKAVLGVFSGVASALDAAYNRPPYAGDKPLRVIHRDIKPSNIMIDANGLPKVLDFGVARAEFDSREAKTAELSFGSVEYMSPERLFFEPDSPASDVYSLGVTLYEAIALEKFGKAKLRAEAHEQFFAERFEDLLEHNPLPSEEIEDLLHDLLYDMTAFEEAGRPTAAECVRRIRSFARSLPGEGIEEWAERVVPPLLERYGKKTRRRKDGDSTSLVDRVLTEDSGGFDLGGGEEETSIPPDEAPPVHAAMRGGKASWDEMKQATLKSLAGEGLGPASSTWNPEAEPVLQKALGPPAPPAGVVSVPAPSEPGSAAPPEAPLPRAPSQTPPPDPPSKPTEPVIDRPGGAGLGPAGSLGAPQHAPSAPVQADSAAQTVELRRAVPVREEAPTEGSGLWLPMAVGALLLLGIGTGGLLIGAGALALVYGGSGGSRTDEVVDLPLAAPEPAPEAAPEAGEGEPAPDPGEAEGGARLVSHLPGTRKMVARCDGGTFQGATEVQIRGEEIGRCIVAALAADRTRANATILEVEPRTYACFDGNTDTCE